MKYPDFERTMSPARMSRYLHAMGGSSKKAMTLYRKNLKLSQELFTVISCLEVSLRNAIDGIYLAQHGNDWIAQSVARGGMFTGPKNLRTKNVVDKAVRRLGAQLTHHKLVAELEFGFWRYLFAQPQFHAGGHTLLRVFPAKPKSSPAVQYNQTFIFNQLGLINDVRNRIAHHEPICFDPGTRTKSTTYARQHYGLIMQLFQWMNINGPELLYGLDHIQDVCNDIDAL
jgi:hypothetical protein